MPENAKDELAWSPKTNGFEHHILRGNSHTKRAPVFHVPSRCQYLLLPWRSTIGRIFPRWSMLSAILAGSVPMIVGLKSPLPITSHHFRKVADSYHLRIIFEWTRRLSETSVATKPDTWRFFKVWGKPCLIDVPANHGWQFGICDQSSRRITEKNYMNLAQAVNRPILGIDFNSLDITSPRLVQFYVFWSFRQFLTWTNHDDTHHTHNQHHNQNQSNSHSITDMHDMVVPHSIFPLYLHSISMIMSSPLFGQLSLFSK